MDIEMIFVFTIFFAAISAVLYYRNKPLDNNKKGKL